MTAIERVDHIDMIYITFLFRQESNYRPIPSYVTRLIYLAPIEEIGPSHEQRSTACEPSVNKSLNLSRAA